MAGGADDGHAPDTSQAAQWILRGDRIGTLHSVCDLAWVAGFDHPRGSGGNRRSRVDSARTRGALERSELYCERLDTDDSRRRAICRACVSVYPASRSCRVAVFIEAVELLPYTGSRYLPEQSPLSGSWPGQRPMYPAPRDWSFRNL